MLGSAWTSKDRGLSFLASKNWWDGTSLGYQGKGPAIVTKLYLGLPTTRGDLEIWNANWFPHNQFSWRKWLVFRVDSMPLYFAEALPLLTLSPSSLHPQISRRFLTQSWQLYLQFNSSVLCLQSPIPPSCVWWFCHLSVGLQYHLRKEAGMWDWGTGLDMNKLNSEQQLKSLI